MDISFAMEGLFKLSFLGNLYVFEKTVLFFFCSCCQYVHGIRLCYMYGCSLSSFVSFLVKGKSFSMLIFIFFFY